MIKLIKIDYFVHEDGQPPTAPDQPGLSITMRHTDEHGQITVLSGEIESDVESDHPKEFWLTDEDGEPLDIVEHTQMYEEAETLLCKLWRDLQKPLGR